MAPSRPAKSSTPRAVHVEVGELRVPAGLMLAAGAVLPALDSPLPGCPLRALTGVPCPLCGMTTSVTATLNGDLLEALQSAPAGIALVATALWVLLVRRPQRVKVGYPLVLGLLGSMWIFQLFRFSLL